MIKHIIAGGCSFTADGIGGIPPTLTDPDGGCTFTENTDFSVNAPKTWVGHVSKKLNVKSLVNLAGGSHGNYMLSNNILQLIQRFDYNARETLILFNLSDPSRLDIVCDWNSTEKSNQIYWLKNILPFTYCKHNSNTVNTQKKLTDIDHTESSTSMSILGLLSFLKNQDFNFAFTMMNDYTNHKYLGPVIQNFQHNLVSLSPGPSMIDFIQAKNLATPDGHPNELAHQLIAEQVIIFCEKL